MRPHQRRKDNLRANVRADKPRLSGIHSRVVGLVSILFIGFILMQARLVTVATLPVAEANDIHATQNYEPPRRGDIYDINGTLLATSLTTYSLYADPKYVMDVNEVVTKLRMVLPDLSDDLIRRRVTKDNRFVWLKKNLTPKQVYAVNALGLPGLGFREERTRFYPQEERLAHLMGAVNYKNQGVSGFEAAYNDKLVAGEDLHTTIDMRLQNKLHKVLAKSLKETKAKGVWGVVLDAKTAQVRAIASLPTFDPNHYGEADPKLWFNPTISGVYEMGSTFKIFTLAQALEQDIVDLDTLLDARFPLRIGKYRIHDPYPKARWMTAAEVFKYSSNIGASLIADQFGAVAQQNFLRSLNLTSTIGVPLKGEVNPLMPPMRNWKRLATMNIAFGHGLAVTPLQLTAAVRAVSVDGDWRMPTFDVSEQGRVTKKVVSKQTTQEIRKLMRMVVESGTGQKANVGYDVGGKTGTAEKAAAGGYARNKNMASFVGVIPAEKPELVALFMVDEGLDGEGSGGGVAAPVFGDFVENVAPIIGLEPKQKNTDYGFVNAAVEGGRREAFQAAWARN